MRKGTKQVAEFERISLCSNIRVMMSSKNQLFISPINKYKYTVFILLRTFAYTFCPPNNVALYGSTVQWKNIYSCPLIILIFILLFITYSPFDNIL